MTKRILVTGYNGYIGKHLCNYLIAKACYVRAADRNLEEHAPNIIDDYICILDIDPDTEWGDVLTEVDCIVHLAARVHVMKEHATNSSSEFWKVNTAGTLQFSRQAAAIGVRRFIYISTIKVHGEETETGIHYSEDSDTNPNPNPRDPYSVSKLEAEKKLMDIARVTGMEVVIIRPPLVYGPGVKANFRNMMKWLDKGIPLPLGLANNLRNLVAVENLVSFIDCCINHPAAANETFLISDGKDLSVRLLLIKLGLALGKKAVLVPVPTSFLWLFAGLFGLGATVSRLLGTLQIDTAKANNLLGWQPIVSVDQALEKTAKDYLANR